MITPATRLRLIYDGGCPFCCFFAERCELQGKLPRLEIVDGRRDHELRQRLRQRGFSLATGAMVLVGEDPSPGVLHGARAIAALSSTMAPSTALLGLLSRLLQEPRRAQRLYPLLLLARRLALAVRRLPVDPDKARTTTGPLSGPRATAVDSERNHEMSCVKS